MSPSPQPPMIVELPWTTRVASVLHSALRRADGRAAGALLALIAAMMAWNYARWLGEMTPQAGSPPEIWWSVLCVETVCSTLLVGATLLADAAVEAGAPRTPAYALAIVLSAAAGAGLQYAVREFLGLRVSMDTPTNSPNGWSTVQPLIVFFDVLQRSTLLVFIYVNQRTTMQARRRQQAAEIARAKARRRTLESRLQALQARVEPQFLLSTLAQVSQLYDRDAALADAMLDDLIAYLRAALPHLRESTSTLAKEIALAGAYLNILRTNTGGGLTFDVDVAEGVRTAPLPAMVLLPLISHVLAARSNRSAAAGGISVTALVAGRQLVLTIRGGGTIFVPADEGQELSDLKGRVHALYGDDATLEMALRGPQALEAVLALPFEVASDAGDGSVQYEPRLNLASVT